MSIAPREALGRLGHRIAVDVRDRHNGCDRVADRSRAAAAEGTPAAWAFRVRAAAAGQGPGGGLGATLVANAVGGTFFGVPELVPLVGDRPWVPPGALN